MKTKLYSMNEIAGICLQTGIAPWPSVTAVAIAWAESGGNAYAVFINDDLSIDLGVWQTNTRWHPEIPVASALDPVAQCEHVKRIAGKSSWQYVWTPWATYKNGLHSHFIPYAYQAVKAAGGLL